MDGHKRRAVSQIYSWRTMAEVPVYQLFVFSVLSTFLYFPSTVSPAPSHGDEYGISYNKITYAAVNLTYRDPATGIQYSKQDDRMGLFSSESRIDSEWGWVVHVRTADNKTHGCTKPVNTLAERWIALVERGTCRFHDKIHNAAIVQNASAVVVYDHENSGSLLAMKHSVSDVVSIFITRQDGEKLAALVDNGTKVLMYVSVGHVEVHSSGNMNRTSVLFVSISFIILMVISLAWLIFYYIQRFRYAHTKDQHLQRLMNAAKKALNRMGQKTLHRGDRETDQDFDMCAICVECYKVSDTVRILPCKHVFHKSCVDPWLIEHRSCPICKLDILLAYGIHVNGTRESQGSNISTNTDYESPYFLVEASELLLNENGHFTHNPSNSAAHSISEASTTEQHEATLSLISTTRREQDD